MPSVKWDNRAKLPSEPGVYWAYARWQLLYVGRAKDLQERWSGKKHHQISALERLGCTHICYRIVRNRWIRHHTEAVEIQRNKPPLNDRNETPDYWLSLLDNFVEIVMWSVAAFLVWDLGTKLLGAI